MQKSRLYRTALCAVMAIVMLLCAPTVAFAATNYDCSTGNHRYSVTIEQKPTETETGLRKYACDLCNYSYTSAIPCTGHIWGEWQTETEATCQAEGLQYRVCQNYAEHREEQPIPVAEHDYQKSVTKEPTCTEPGVLTYSCPICNDSYTENIPATGHSYGEWITDKEPTLREKGHKYRECLNDKSHIKEETIEVLEMTISAVDIVFAATGVSLAWLFAFLIGGDIYVLLWYKKLKKKQLENMKGQD